MDHAGKAGFVKAMVHVQKRARYKDNREIHQLEVTAKRVSFVVSMEDVLKDVGSMEMKLAVVPAKAIA